MSLGSYREQIDKIDRQIVELFEKRMDVVKQVAEYKLENGMEVLHPEREREVLDSKAAIARVEYAGDIRELFEKIMELSRNMQKKILDATK